MKESINILERKLDVFIDRYYRNQVYKGLILTLSVSLIALFLVSTLEYLGRFGSGTRLFLWWTYLLGVGFIFFWYLLRPGLALLKLNRKMNREKAAVLIGKHFPAVEDKLLNALQLGSTIKEDNHLLLASIEQRTANLSPVPFQNAINFKANYTYLKYGLIPGVLLLCILLVSPGFKNSTDRIIHYNETFEREAPFDFIYDSQEFSAIQNEPIRINLSLEGDEIPLDAYLLLDELKYKMKSGKDGQFYFELPGQQNSASLRFQAAGFESQSNELIILRKPSLLAYDARIEFPKYLNRKDEFLKGTGNISLPIGTKVHWSFKTKDVNQLELRPENIKLELSKNSVQYSKRFLQSEQVNFHTSNEDLSQGDSLNYQIQIIPDLYPSITLESKSDSGSAKILYLIGDIRDDYGFSKLSFHYQLGEKPEQQLDIPISNNVNEQSFFHLWNLAEIGLKAGDELDYYFQVSDNDGIQGPKSARTRVYQYTAPTIAELQAQTEQKNEELKNDLSEAQSEVENLQKAIEDVERMLTEKDKLDWEDKQKIEDLLQKQEEVQKQIEESVRNNQLKNNKEEEFSPMSEKLLEKQQKLEELFNEVMDNETKELMEKIRKLMEENKTEELQREMEKLSLSEKEMNKELDRMLELFKELELEKKMEQSIQKMEELAKKQDALAEKSEKSPKKDEALQKEQAELKKEMEELEQDMKDIQKKNEELENPKDISTPEQLKQEAEQEMNEAEENLSKGKNKKASENQRNAAQKMRDMAQQMQAQMDAAYEEQQEEDYRALRQILENLIQLSFDQEELQDEFSENTQYSPKYIELRQKQRKIKDDTKIVEDSLLALSKRVLEIKHFINKEISEINHSLDKGLAHLGERRTGEAMVHQQIAMTSMNNLALMLSQSLEQMQQQMASANQSKGKPKANCQKPGGGNKKKGKQNMNSIQKMQQDLAKQLEEMKNGMQKGTKPGSKEFAQMAAKQAAIRQQIRDLQRQLQKEGKGGSLGDLQHTQDLMDQMEQDLYYKRLNQESMRRLQEIQIKLSQHERAEKEQEREQKRTSTEGQDPERRLPPEIEKYLNEKSKLLEQLQMVSPELRPYYQNKVKSYFNQRP